MAPPPDEPSPMFTLISGGEVFAPEPLGRRDVLMCGKAIVKIDAFDRRALEAAGFEVEHVDARGCCVFPGIIDPHQHLIGGSGEDGFHSQSADIRLAEIVRGGMTTVVGCLGVDTTTRTMPQLLARVKGFRHYGLSAYLYSGGYNVPPTTLTDSLRNDVMFIDEVIGAGEVAISDHRSSQPSTFELARVVRDAAIGGLLSGKAGVTNFHVGEEPGGLAPIRALLDDCHLDPSLLYPTHVARSKSLLEEAVGLTKRGVTVDIDMVEGDLATHVRSYLDEGGDPARLTISSDADSTSPTRVCQQLCACFVERCLPIELLLPMATSNTARILKLKRKGRLAAGNDADAIVVRRDTFALTTVIAGGQLVMRDGTVTAKETWLADSDRRFEVNGEKSKAAAG